MTRLHKYPRSRRPPVYGHGKRSLNSYVEAVQFQMCRNTVFNLAELYLFKIQLKRFKKPLNINSTNFGNFLHERRLITFCNSKVKKLAVITDLEQKKKKTV